MTRLESMGRYIQPYLTSCTAKQIRIIKNMEDNQVIEKIEQLVNEALKRQESDSWVPSYLSIFYLDSSLLTQTYQYQICLSDDQLYFDDKKIEIYWTPSYINLDKKSEEIRRELAKKFVRIKEYEVEYLLRLCAKQYRQITEVHLKQVYEKTFKESVFPKLHKTTPFVFLYGSYMGELKHILTVN